MTDEPLILSIDQGTTSSRAILFDTRGRVVAAAQQSFPLYQPQSGWVEQDPEEIWDSVVKVVREVLAEADTLNRPVMGIGITNQRETTLVWERKTGKAIHNAIVWQDRRTAGACHELAARGEEETVRAKTGLLLDPYFSATKVAWLLDNVDGARARAEAGELAFGTIDSFLIWRLTGGERHVTDATNASRTNLFNIHTQAWDEALLDLFNVPAALLPDVFDCAADFGTTAVSILDTELPILGVAGDQQAATIGQGCFAPGDCKSTYGTGCFVMANTGTEAVASRHRLLTTVAYRLKGVVHYAIEGSIFNAGSVVQWLRDDVQIIDSAEQTEALAKSVSDTGGVYLVPAFTGLGAPHWNPDVRGAVFGLTRASGKAQLVRAALESVCYQTRDLQEAYAGDGIAFTRLRVDGGMAVNNWLCQFLADMLEVEVERPVHFETTAQGVSFLVALQAGLIESIEVAAAWREVDRVFKPQMDAKVRKAHLAGWEQAVGQLLAGA
ncbi:glycerol kinase GlpK [Marinimicrobium alkaliphilum]|uniref:glycerol kinase GlpK n=1 Tax=Marinimicrobium alkaliphilum TaxID=2202654 RepID=UPI000DB969E5|nr:glycerol kinase GlpK [Marinimicrobium alkaliphilum]